MSKNKPSDDNQITKKPSLFKQFYHGLVSGGLAGAFEVLVDHPFWQLKTRYQDPKIATQDKMPRDIRTFYRGMGPNMASMIPITAIQVGSASTIKAGMQKQKGSEPLSGGENLTAACTGGALSSAASGPTELIMSHQTKSRGFFTTAYEMVRKNGIGTLKTGMAGTAIRDGIFTGAYLAGKPYLKSQLTDSMSPNTADASAAIGSGIAAGVLSQPSDTIKTRQQTEGNPTKGFTGQSMLSTARDIYRESGFKGFYNGFMFRTARVCSAIMIIGKVNEAVDKRLKHR